MLVQPIQLLPALCALALGASRAPAGYSEALRFNKAFVDFNKKLSNAGVHIGVALRPALQGNRADLKELKRAYIEAVWVVGQVKKSAAALKVPDSDSARKLARTYTRFLRGQEVLIKENMGELLGLVESANPPDQAGAQRLLRLLQAIAERELSDLQELQQAQREFADAHGIKLKQAP